MTSKYEKSFRAIRPEPDLVIYGEIDSSEFDAWVQSQVQNAPVFPTPWRLDERGAIVAANNKIVLVLAERERDRASAIVKNANAVAARSPN